jgi:thiosulfate dehydrogenase
MSWFWLTLLACSEPAPSAPPAPPAPPAPVAAAPAPASGEIDWVAPDESTLPAGPMGDSIRRGLELFVKTNQLLPDHVPSNMTCSNCHLDKGRQPYAVPMVGAHARFPKYMERTGATITLQDRVNYCFTRSLAGSRLPVESQEMTDLVNYIAWLSQGIPVGKHIAGEALPELKPGGVPLRGDAARGEALYVEKGCVACHQADGSGVPNTFPALWGPKSYSIGASMAREERAAAFIQRFMPQTAPGSLSPQEAYDLSAFINSHGHPDSPAKENDWPEGGAPYDVPYATKGHEAFQPPPELYPRENPELAVVPKPPPIAELTGQGTKGEKAKSKGGKP